MDNRSDVLLELNGVETWYGPLRALSDVSFTVTDGSIKVILGNNGAGKSTLLNTILGVLEGQPKSGKISFRGTRIDRMATERIVRAGISYVPEGRRIFGELTVRENLKVGAYIQTNRFAARQALDRVYGFFPLLAERQSQAAGTLSGGEQQMLAIGRALMNGPRVLLLDEPSLGLAPILVRQVFDIISQIRDEGVTVLLVEQNARMALAVADEGLVLDSGELVAAGSASDLVDNAEVEELYMGASSLPTDRESRHEVDPE
ncbi:MAG TPA: ABC transporter ATP-binding protein [Gemmatimonadetes bacterium]|jgi:branched-chain amino acid transport system ATP-binding protein|nr:ABC transporter ATP-binding protein [Gemmatimonadota bacterium]HIA73075.1 ABC transporter ATP-binding protein [Gemmatimonadota bacterium]HIC14423.1 ABC transporter ATP-binding protein [Gemmatimonadota bacterium]